MDWLLKMNEQTKHNKKGGTVSACLEIPCVASEGVRRRGRPVPTLGLARVVERDLEPGVERIDNVVSWQGVHGVAHGLGITGRVQYEAQNNC